MQQQAWCQTAVRGKVLSVDGRTIPSTAISIYSEKPKDTFSSHNEQILPGEDGSYEILIREPGIYRITFRGVFHQELRVPVLIYDQASIEMDILLLPIHYNDGAYFKNEEYLKWIRIYGNFNEYSYLEGNLFSLNSDGSISTFIPVTSDTLRYLVDGIAYGGGTAALPTADDYHFNEDHGFESLLYKDLPEDSLEIRYTPGLDIPYKRYLPAGMNPLRITLRGFICLKNQKDENWIEPLISLRPHNRIFEFVDREMSSGIPVQTQLDIQKKYTGSVFDTDLSEELEEIGTELREGKLHQQQRVILTMSYTSILGWMTRKTLFQQMRNEHELLKKSQPESRASEIKPDQEIINSIPEIVPPVHPAWRFNNAAVDYLLTESDQPATFINYFRDVVNFNPDDRSVRLIASSIIRHFGSEYSSVEEMPTYQIILERYGENDIARDAHRAFEHSHLDD